MSDSVQNEFEMLSLFEMTPDLVCIAGRDGYFKKVNPAVIATLQYSAEEIYSRRISSFIHPDDREFTSRERAILLQGKPLLNFQNRYMTKNGETVWLEWTSVYLPQKGIVFAIAKNISANKRKEKEFAEKYNTYKNLAHHFKHRAEEDRRYLAYELHEEVAQLAASLKLQIEAIHQHMAGVSDGVSSKMDEIMSIADMLVKAIRRISFTINPSMLDDLGFNETMEWACREFAALNGTSCHYLCDCGDDEWSKEMKADVFRICQQALGSIAEQEGVSSVTIHLKKMDDAIALDICSDGRGMDTGHVMTNMHQLAASMNARLLVADEHGRGTKISLNIEKDKTIVNKRR